MRQTSSSRRSWARKEVEAVVADYFEMLGLELSGQQYSKSVHRRALMSQLDGRSDGSVELKHQNISAILIAMGSPWISGYKPMKNYQAMLLDVVANRLKLDMDFDQAAVAAVERPAIPPDVVDYSKLLVSPPSLRRVKEPVTDRVFDAARHLIRRDYLGMERENRSLGQAGEKFVVAYEKHRLSEIGSHDLVDRVEHVAVTRGDGLGFDVLSFDTRGREKYIEVKTTTFGMEAPFFLSRNELEFSKREARSFHLYRIFEFRRAPRMYKLGGPVDRHCLLEPISYRAHF